MTTSIDLAGIGALLGDPARAAMLEALIDGRALTAKELAFRARITAQTASLHLRKLTESNLLSVINQGRHRYFRIASPLVARMIEAVGAVAAVHAPPRYRPTGPRDAKLRDIRMCYDHLAGRLAVAIADALVARDFLRLETDGGEITAAGFAFFGRLGLTLDGERQSRRAFCKPCLDWSERRFHIGGFLGSAFAERCLALGWIERERDSRAVTVTPIGQTTLADHLGIRFGPIAAAA